MSVQLDGNGDYLVEPGKVFGLFTMPFHSVYNNFSAVVFPKTACLMMSCRYLCLRKWICSMTLSI